MAAEVPQRRSVHERLAQKKQQPHPLADVDFSFDVTDETTSTFRVQETGELVEDTAGTLAGAMEAVQSLGELSEAMGISYHLLALPHGRTGEEAEALAISVWNEAGWINPGVLHLTEGVTLEGPWDLAPEVRDTLGLSSEMETVWLLRCQGIRGAAPSEEVKARDELARAFPAGMPVGVELVSLGVLRRISRRLGGAVRIAGSGHVLAQDPGSAVNLNVYTSDPLPPSELGAVLTDLFGEVQQVSADQVEDPQSPQPHAMLVELEGGAKLLVGMRPADRVPRALRWEPWVRPHLYHYEVTWANAFEHALPGGHLSRVGRRKRDRASQAVSQASAALAAATRNVAIIDEDDFLVSVDELELDVT